ATAARCWWTAPRCGSSPGSSRNCPPGITPSRCSRWTGSSTPATWRRSCSTAAPSADWSVAMASPQPYDAVGRAAAALADGLPVLVVDDESRENEGDVVLAAATATPEWTAWMIRNTSGLVCAPMPAERTEALALPQMVGDNRDPKRTAYTVTVDAATGVSTGISAADRTRTLRVLADPRSRADDLIRPGHVLPLRAVDGGVVERPGHTEAAVELCELAGLPPVGAI